MDPIPDNIKTILGELTGPQQVALRGYIATLRADMRKLQEELLAANDTDDHAHYHGHEKCTADHGHAHTDHKKEEEHGHDHGHSHGHEKCTADHGHAHADHKKEEHGHDHGHSHGHDNDKMCTDDHSHGHGHEEEKAKSNDSHSHAHDDHKKHGHEVKDDTIPAWKKKAMEADPNAAPFGGSWSAESNVTASKASEKMQE